MLARQPGLNSELLTSDWPVTGEETLCKKKKGDEGLRKRERRRKRKRVINSWEQLSSGLHMHIHTCTLSQSGIHTIIINHTA